MSEVRSSARFTIHLRSPNNNNSSITKLHNEVLLLIFLINSRIDILSPMDQEKAYQSPTRCIGDAKGALINNRHASQVCRRWRSIALSSSTCGPTLSKFTTSARKAMSGETQSSRGREMLVSPCPDSSSSEIPYSNIVQAHFHLWNITDISYEVELVQEDPQEQPYPFYQIVLKDCQQDRIATQFEYHGISQELVKALSMAPALSSFQLHRVTSFYLRLDVYEDTLNDPSFDAMYNLLRKLEFVENLHTDKRTLELLPVAELRAGNVVFPKLHTIIVHEWDVSLEKFLDLRREGRPVTRVVLSEGSSVSVGDPTVLQMASTLGITVGWKIEGIKGVREFPISSRRPRFV